MNMQEYLEELTNIKPPITESKWFKEIENENNELFKSILNNKE